MITYTFFPEKMQRNI